MADNRPIAYVEDGVSYYRASGTGGCLLAVVAAKNGYEAKRNQKTQDILMSAAKEGNLHEGAIVEELKDTYRWRVWGGQELVELQILPKVIIRGHIDGFCKPPRIRKTRLVEIKTMSKDRFKKWMASGDTARERLLTEDFKKYGWQISQYMHAYNMTAMYVVKNRDSGVLDIEWIELPLVDLKTIRAKIIAVEMWSKKGEMPECEGASGERWFCEYPYLHDVTPFPGNEPDNEKEVVGDISEVLVNSIAEHYYETAKKTAYLKALDDERKDIGQKLIEAMGGVNQEKVRVSGEYEIKRTDSFSSKLDTKELANELGITVEDYDALLERHKVKTPHSYVSVKKIGDK